MCAQAIMLALMLSNTIATLTKNGAEPVGVVFENPVAANVLIGDWHAVKSLDSRGKQMDLDQIDVTFDAKSLRLTIERPLDGRLEKFTHTTRYTLKDGTLQIGRNPKGNRWQIVMRKGLLILENEDSKAEMHLQRIKKK